MLRIYGAGSRPAQSSAASPERAPTARDSETPCELA